MKLHIVLLFILGACGFVRSAPLDSNKPIAVSLEAFEVDKSKPESLESITTIKKSATELETQNEVIGAKGGSEGAVQGSISSNSAKKICPLKSDFQDEMSPVTKELMMNANAEASTFWNNQIPRTYYQVDYLTNLDRSVAGVDNNQGVLYPFVNPNVYPVTSPVSSVSYLPPVYSPRMYDPSYEALVVPKNVRSVRSREDDFMSELEHDAMMNNIIPTMPVPFVRHAGYSAPVYQAPVTAVFQHGGGNSIPILLSCSPEIVRGSFESVYSGKHELPTSYNVAYRFQDADQTDNGLNHDGM